jgi:hypothetical protein
MAGPLSKEDIKELLNAAAPLLSINELEEYEIIVNELEKYYETDATIEDQNIMARWITYISKNANDVVRFVETLKSLNQGVDNVYPTDMPDENIGFYLAARQDYLDPANGYSPAEKRRGLEDVDETYGFDIFNIPIFQDRNEESLKNILAEAENAWYSQDIRAFDLLKSYEESATQINIIDRNNNRTSTPEEINTFVFDNSYSGNMTTSERSFNDTDRWVYLDAKNNSALLRPDVLNEDDFLQLFLDEAVEAGRISPTVRSFMKDPDQEITLETALNILQDLGIKEIPESYFTTGKDGAISQVDLMMSEWATDQKAKIKNQYTNIMTGGEDFNEAISGFLKKDADDYVAVFGSQEINRQARQDLFDNYSWDPTKDIATNVKSMFSAEQTDGEGLIYNLNPNDKNWPKSLIDIFDIKNIQSAAGEAQRQLISNLANTEAGRRYLAKVEAGQTPTVQESFNVFNEIIEEIGEDGGKFLTKTVDTLTFRDEIDYQKDKSDPKKMRQHAANIVFSLESSGKIDPDLFGFIDEGQIARDLQNYPRFADALADTQWFDDIIIVAKENKRLGAFDQDMGSVSGQKSAVNTILDNFTPAQKSAFDKASDEQKNAVYSAVAPFGSGQEAILDPNFFSLLNNTINAGQATIDQAQFSAFQSAIPDYVLATFKSKDLINANTSEDFYNHLQNEVIPNIEFRAQMVGVDSPDSLERLIDSMLSGKDQAGNAVEYALPAYDYNQSDYDRQLGVTAADVLSGAAMPPSPFGRKRVEDVSAKYDLSNLLPEIQPYAKTNPEFAAFMAQEMEKEGFMKEWQKATTAQPLQDRGADLQLQEDERAYWGGRLSNAQAAYDANPSQENADALQKAQSDDAKAEQHYQIETGKSKFAVFPPEEGADDPSQYTLPDQLKDRQLISDPSLPDEIRYAGYFKALEGISPEDPMTETERQKILADFMTPSAKYVFDPLLPDPTDPTKKAPVKGAGASEVAQLMTTTPQTTPEFFQSQLPGFEKRYKESSFFTQEQDRIKREQDQEQQRAESQRRRQLRQRPTGMSVFTRARR